ncbi:hypothetical protein HID58_066089, partial [Brassica napus]
SLPFSNKNIKYVDPEEEDVEEKDYENSDEEDGNHGVERYGSSSSSVFDFYASHSARDSGLPSANDVFSQISGPPEFLNNRTEADEEATARDAEHAKRMTQMKGSPFDDVNCVSTKESPAASVVMEAKPQLVGIHERNGGKRISTATNPNAEEAADLLRFELYCWILLALALEPLQIVWTISFLLIQQNL